MLHFATLFDVNYLTRGLALIGSLEKHCSVPFEIFVLALDNEVPSYFDKVGKKNIKVVSLEKIETFFPELRIAKTNRKTVEYYFTLSPYWPLYILENYSYVDQIATLDSDILFFDDPCRIFNTYPNASILITPHNFAKNLSYMKQYGVYNVSFQNFKRSSESIRCLEEWRAKCFEWCYDELDNMQGRFADQKYLNHWEQDYNGVQAINIPSAGVAPWNLGQYKLSNINSKIFINGEALIYYHYHHLRVIDNRFALHGFDPFNIMPLAKNKAIKKIYHTYLLELKKLNTLTSLSDKNIVRYQSSIDNTWKKLNNTNGFWLFNSTYIWHINILELKKKLKKIIGRK